MIDDFLVRALLAGLGVAIVAGPFGCFVVWRRLAYLGETLAHTALLGVALGLLIDIDLIFGMIVAVVAAALVLAAARRRAELASDTVLGILASSTLAAGLIAVAAVRGARLDLMGYLFGDILAVRTVDLYVIYGGGAVALVVLAWMWRPLLSATIHGELARIDGVNVAAIELVLMLMLALVVAIAGRMVGILLVIALLVIPAATARRFARSPETMAVMATLIGAVAVVAGLWGSFTWDTPAGPSMVVAAALLCAAAWLVPRRHEQLRG